MHEGYLNKNGHQNNAKKHMQRGNMASPFPLCWCITPTPLGQQQCFGKPRRKSIVIYFMFSCESDDLLSSASPLLWFWRCLQLFFGQTWSELDVIFEICRSPYYGEHLVLKWSFLWTYEENKSLLSQDVNASEMITIPRSYSTVIDDFLQCGWAKS